ncbi:aldehyde dehydrogenase family protein [Neptunomonas sp.]|uniref:aldehyde dehydrogenase family protein n=1 Tax=Neptunomonas sp. TaxID=1971898 RepID=UPI003565EDCB
MSLELGGNAPLIVLTMPTRTKRYRAQLFRNSEMPGKPVCANRILVQCSVYDALMEIFSEAVRKLTVGHGLQGTSQAGGMTLSALVGKA